MFGPVKLAALSIFLFTVLCSVPSIAAGKRVALVIGNAAYTRIAPLKKPPSDAQKIAAVLKSMGFEVILGIDLTKKQMVDLAQKFDDAVTDADVGFFFFSGHGFQTAQVTQQHPINHIVAIDFSVDTVESDLATLSLDVIIDALRRKARLGFIFMDACRSDPQLAKASQRYANSRTVRLSRGFSPVNVDTTEPAPVKLAQGKGPMGMLIAYATDPGNIALEGDKGEFSPFTGALAKNIVSPGLSIAEVMGRVSAQVAAETKGQQTPWNVASLTAGAYQFVPAPAKPTTSVGRQGGNGGTGSAGRNNNLPPNLGVGVGGGL